MYVVYRYEEWGDPNEPSQLRAMEGYCRYVIFRATVSCRSNCRALMLFNGNDAVIVALKYSLDELGSPLGSVLSPRQQYRIGSLCMVIRLDEEQIDRNS